MARVEAAHKSEGYFVLHESGSDFVSFAIGHVHIEERKIKFRFGQRLFGSCNAPKHNYLSLCSFPDKLLQDRADPRIIFDHQNTKSVHRNYCARSELLCSIRAKPVNLTAIATDGFTRNRRFISGPDSLKRALRTTLPAETPVLSKYELPQNPERSE